MKFLEGIPDNILEGASAGIMEGIPEAIPERTPGGIHEEIPGEIAGIPMHIIHDHLLKVKSGDISKETIENMGWNS